GGRAVPGQTVQVQPVDGANVWCEESDADGVARFVDLPAGAIDVLAFAPNRERNRDRPARRLQGGSFDRRERRTPRAGEPATLETPSSAAVHVRLKLNFPSGTAAANVKFSELSPREGPARSSYDDEKRVRELRLITDDRGRVEADLLPGAYDCVLAIDSLRV